MSTPPDLSVIKAAAGAMARLSDDVQGSRSEAEWAVIKAYRALMSPATTEALIARVEAAEGALKPFADAYDFWNAADGGVHDDTEIDDQGKITIADCRRAREALTPTGGQ